MATTFPVFAAQHQGDRAFFAAFVAVCWIGVIFGFFPASSARLMGRADYVAPLILHIHAALFVGWLVLLTVQVLLIRSRRPALHMRLGLVGLALVPLMAITGVAAELYSQRFYLQRDTEGLDFFILPLFYIAAFTAFALAALLYARRDSATHKRLVLLATTVIVGAAYARWWGVGLTGLVGDGYGGMLVNTFTGTNLIMVAAVAYDIVTRGRPHRAYVIGVPLLLAGQLACSWIYHAPWWPPLARGIIESDVLRLG
jgi:hypothetical protein